MGEKELLMERERIIYRANVALLHTSNSTDKRANKQPFLLQSVHVCSGQDREGSAHHPI